MAGLKSARRANIAIYNSDLVIAIGSRLATSVIGFEYEKFAPSAEVFIVDIDPNEHAKKLARPCLFVKWMHLNLLKYCLLSPYMIYLLNVETHGLVCLKMKELLPLEI